MTYGITDSTRQNLSALVCVHTQAHAHLFVNAGRGMGVCFSWGSGCIVAGVESRKPGTAGLSLQGDRTEGELEGATGQNEKEKERGQHVQAGRRAGRLLTGSFEAAAGWSGGLTSCASTDLSPHFSTSSSSPNSTTLPPTT